MPVGDIPTSMLISAVYDGPRRRAALKFYNGKTHRLETYHDGSGHLPYCYARLSPQEIRDHPGMDDRDDIKDILPTKVRDNLADMDVEVSKIVVSDPLAIGGTQSGRSIRDMMQTWESDIKYYENYLYDRQLVMGRYYSVSGDKITEQDLPIPEAVSAALKSLLLDRETGKGMPDPEQYQQYVTEWAQTLNQPIPEIRRISFDIEVDSERNRIPDPHLAERRVTAVGFEGSDAVREVYVLGKKGAREAETPAQVTYYEDERQMILDAFKKIADYPVVLTFNGDDFDMPYLHNRANRLGVPAEDNPLYMMRDAATLKRGVHVDLYRTFSNRAFQVYAFSNKYSEYSLNSVSAALLGEKKLDYGVPLDDLTPEQLASYCYNDARLTYMLTSFGGDLLMKLLVVISRIARMPIDDIARLGVSQWIRSLLYYEHRRHNMLIPKRDDLNARFEGRASTDAVMKDKKYRGGLVVDPQKGIHFRVTVMDFASLYPSIIKVQNLSYETVRCAHGPECESNRVPDTSHWVCKRRNGLTALLIGSLRDLRVNYYKSLSRDETLGDVERQQYSVVSQALKIILNASYGVMGAEMFPLYFLPAAEATTAIGRHIILETIKKCEASGIEILYGDTDSIFIKDPTPAQVQEVIEAAKADHGVELEVDKEYRYVVLSDRKKNYFGVTTSGKVDVKGLTGKKSHTPPFIRALFGEITGILSDVSSEEDFERIKVRISAKMRECAERLNARKIPLEELAFNVMLSKAPSEYTKNIPQHIKAAMQLERASSAAGDLSSFVGGGGEGASRKVKKGDIISYVKTVTRPGVKPVELARPDEVDSAKYMEFMESTLDQVTSVLGMNFAEIMGAKKQSALGDFFHGA